MAISAKQIIAAIEKDFPKQKRLEKKEAFLYFIGVHSDKRYYEYLVDESSEDASGKRKHYLWPFNDDELDELRSSLNELSDYLDQQLDIDFLFEAFNIHDKGGIYYIVITVQQDSILSG